MAMKAQKIVADAGGKYLTIKPVAAGEATECVLVGLDGDTVKYVYPHGVPVVELDITTYGDCFLVCEEGRYTYERKDVSSIANNGTDLTIAYTLQEILWELKKKLAEMQGNDDTLADSIITLTGTLSTGMEAEQQARSAADDALAARLLEVEKVPVGNVKTEDLEAAVAAEAAARSAADDSLAQTLIDLSETVANGLAEEETARVTQENILHGDIGQEAATRAQVDNQLTVRIKALEDAPGGGIDQGAVDAAVAAEATARSAADDALAARVTVVEGATGVADLTDLQADVAALQSGQTELGGYVQPILNDVAALKAATKITIEKMQSTPYDTGSWYEVNTGHINVGAQFVTQCFVPLGTTKQVLAIINTGGMYVVEDWTGNRGVRYFPEQVQWDIEKKDLGNGQLECFLRLTRIM